MIIVIMNFLWLIEYNCNGTYYELTKYNNTDLIRFETTLNQKYLLPNTCNFNGNIKLKFINIASTLSTIYIQKICLPIKPRITTYNPTNKPTLLPTVTPTISPTLIQH